MIYKNSDIGGEINNKDVFSKFDFQTWAKKEELYDTENYLIANFLDKNAKTLEAGTGGGRITLEMKNQGFTSLSAFDYVPELIEVAKSKDASKSISFAIEDARNLSYQDGEFEQLVYLQQIICCIEDDQGRYQATKEAYRILKSGGTAIFSFLNFQERFRKPLYRTYIGYLKLLRRLRGSEDSIQYLPWLKYEGKPNLGAIWDRRPYMYWYELEEAYQLLLDANFQVKVMASDYQISHGRVCDSLANLSQQQIAGALYFVCTK